MANRTGRGQFQKGEDPRRNKAGQRNAQAVAFARSLRDLIIAEGNKAHSVTVNGRTIKGKKVDFMIRSLWSKAMAGEQWAVIFVADRTEGKVKEQVELSGTVAVKAYSVISPDDWDDGDGAGT